MTSYTLDSLDIILCSDLGASGSDSEDDLPVSADEFTVDGERLEDDEVLRLHVMGVQSFFNKLLA